MKKICFRLYEWNINRVLFYSCDMNSKTGIVGDEPPMGHIFLKSTILANGKKVDIQIESFGKLV